MAMQRILFIGMAAIFTFIASPVYSSSDSDIDEQQLQQQRANFKAARQALQNGKYYYFRKLAKTLKDYPLYPYLEYWDINRRMTLSKTKAVNNFIEEYSDTPLASRMRYSWLTKMAKQGHWKAYLKSYESSSSTKMQCYYRTALYQTGDKDAAFDGLEEIWLYGRSLPRNCDPLFDAWREHGLMTQDLIWQRISLAMDNGQIYLARYLERLLDKDRRHWAGIWREIHRNPEKVLTDRRLKRDTPMVRSIVAHGVRRMTRHNPSKAAAIWDKLLMKHAFSEEEFTKTETYIALALAKQGAPEAMHWLANLGNSNEQDVREWRVLTSINQQEWEDALFWLDQLYSDEQSSNRWSYWRARAYEATGRENRARFMYANLAKTRDYYGFLAADKLEMPYHFEHYPLQFTDEELAEIENLPTVVRAREFYAIGDVLNARREWYHLTKQLDNTNLLKAAAVAHEWGWHDRAILTMGKAEYLDDIEIRFPLAHQDSVITYSGEQHVDPSWAYAVMRQESAFAADARSPKGAMGLMQIMPRTGRVIARDLDTRLRNSHQLLDVNTNIRFGISYLRKVMNRFDQNIVLATAAYNAGSQRVKSWLPEEEVMTPDLWIENVPFTETRHYLKQVLAFTAIYDERMKKPVTPLKKRMPIILPPAS